MNSPDWNLAMAKGAPCLLVYGIQNDAGKKQKRCMSVGIEKRCYKYVIM